MTTSHKGVYRRNDRSRWKAAISVNGKQISLGLFDDPEKAAEAYVIAEAKYSAERQRKEPAICEVCTEPYMRGKNATQYFCSDKCRRVLRPLRRPAPKSDPSRPRVCLGCGANLSHRRIDVNTCNQKCYAIANRKKLNENNRRAGAKRYERNRYSVIQYLKDNPCVDCGESDLVVLEFDHREPSEKSAQIGNVLGSWSWERLMTEIVKCDVRCANCHRRRTSRQRGWFKEGVMPNDTSLD